MIKRVCNAYLCVEPPCFLFQSSLSLIRFFFLLDGFSTMLVLFHLLVIDICMMYCCCCKSHFVRWFQSCCLFFIIAILHFIWIKYSSQLLFFCSIAAAHFDITTKCKKNNKDQHNRKPWTIPTQKKKKEIHSYNGI